MITKIDTKTAQELVLRYGNDIYTLKIQALLDAYRGYDFCGFFAGRGILLAKYYGDFVLAADGELSEDEIIETAQFLRLSGFNAVLCENALGERIYRHINGSGYRTYVSNLVKFASDEKYGDNAEIKINPPLDDVYGILKTAFELDYEMWYVDASHRIRHGVSKSYIYDEISTATLAFDIRGVCFLSLVATRADVRKKGSATKMLKRLCGEFKNENKDIFLICLDERLHFYENAGFERVGRVFNIKKNGVQK